MKNDLMSTGSRCFWAILAGAAASMPVSAASAQDAAAVPPEAESADQGDEIIVTARRRDETLQSVPVTVSAVTGEALETRGITNLEGFARVVPQLFLANSSGSIQGGAIGLRGISAGDGNGFGDQAVAFNIDGVQVARATPRTLSEFDLKQIQVMKGPQALYFGKNSPGGVIAITTADPGDDLEAGGKLAYEFEAREWRGDGFVSVPLENGFGIRLAVSAARMRGWSENITTPGTIYSGTSDYAPRTREFNGRITLKYDDGGPFTARFKFGYGTIRNNGPAANGQRVYCPLGTPQLGGPDDCTADDRVVRASLGPRLGTGGVNTVTGGTIVGVPVYGDGEPYSRQRQYLSGLELRYDLSDTISLASTTGFYKSRYNMLDNFNGADATAVFNPASPAALAGVFFSYAYLGIREVSQELRLSSDFDGPVNFMIGGYYQDQKVVTHTAAGANALNPIQLFPPAEIQQKGTAYSGFGSVSYKPVEEIELSGGVRYSHEKKEFSLFRLYPGALSAAAGGTTFVAGQQVPTTVPERSFHNWSPEATVAWRPNGQITVFASWKRGFLSGGYNAGGTGTGVALIPDRSYDQQVVEGFEGGVKSTLLDGRLRLNLAAYSYDIKGLQVTAVLPGPPPVQVINNAATAKSSGFEVDANFRVAPGIELRSGISYNDAHYTRFTTSPCWGGQTITLGCNATPNAAGAFTTQDLSGDPLVRAPKWAGYVGAGYDAELANGDSLGFAIDANYTSGFFTESLNAPGGRQDSYWLLDASARYKLSNGIEFALIGRNLTNEYYFQRSTAAPFTGGASGVATSFEPDQLAAVSRGREIRVQASFRF